MDFNIFISALVAFKKFLVRGLHYLHQLYIKYQVFPCEGMIGI